MTGENLLIAGAANASGLEKTADFLLTGPRALFKPKVSGIYGGKSLKALCTSSHRVNLSRQDKTYNCDLAFIGRLAGLLLAPVLVVPLGLAAAVGLKLKSIALKKPEAKLYNTISNTYLNLEKLNQQLNFRRKITDAQISQHQKLMGQLYTQSEAYWDVAKTKMGPVIEPLPLFDLEVDKKTNPLHYAIQKGDFPRALEIIQNKTYPISAYSENGSTALHLAVMKGNINLIREIVKANPSALELTNKKGQQPLHLAILNGKTKVATELVKLGANVNAPSTLGMNTPLHFAFKNKNHLVIKLLLDNGAQVSVDKKNTAGRSPMMMAIKSRNPKITAQLLPHANLSLTDSERNNYLNLAVQSGSFEIVKMVYAGMAPLGLKPQPCDFRNSLGNTPLHDAVNLLNRRVYHSEKQRKENVVQIVKFLLDNKANRFIQNMEGHMPQDLISLPSSSLKKEIKTLLS